MKEEWRAVIGYEGMYEVSSLGNVRALDRVIKRCKCGEPLVRKNAAPVNRFTRVDGYPRVSISRDNRPTQRLLHRLVLEAFVGPCPEGMEGCHANGNRADARLVNLRWDTRKGNHADRWAHGTMRVGENTPCAKLTDAAVRSIRTCGESEVAMADRYGVGVGAIRRVLDRKTWKHVA